MAEYQRSRREEERPFEAALLVCGRKDKYQMADEVRDMFEGLEEAPVMVVGYSTHEAMQMIHDYTPTLILSSCSIGRRRRNEVFPIYQRECRTDDRCCLLLALGRSCPDFQWQYFTDRDIIVVPISIVSVSPFILEFSSSIPGVFNFDYSIGFSHNILPMVPLPNIGLRSS